MTALASHRASVQFALESALARTRGRLAITGATGWLGLALAEMAARAGLTPENGRLRLFASRAGSLPVTGGALPLEALAGARLLDGEGWILVHLAGLGKERTREMSAKDFVGANDAILRAALALLSQAEAPRVVYSSSGGVYGPDGLVVSGESEPYGYMKSLQEAEVIAWCAARSIPAIVPRVFNVGGPWGNKLGLYALSSLTMAALGDGPIPIMATGPVFRSYVHIEEMMAILIDHVTRIDAAPAVPFDTAGRETVELGDLAAMVCEAVGADPGRIVRAYDPSRPASWYVGAGRHYRLAAATSGLDAIKLTHIVADTVAALKDAR